MGDVVLDFELQEGEILFQFLERAEKYAMQFSKYYDGYNFNENIRFDKNGNAIGVSYIEKSNLKNIAFNKDIVEELQSGQIVQEIVKIKDFNQEKKEEREEIQI